MSLMSGLYVGSSGLQTSQNALNTTAHNLSNIETTGYTRQQVLLEDRTYNNIGASSVSKKQIGLGVDYAQVRQVRDVFLDQSYRKESGRSAFYEVNYQAISEIETLLGEFDGVAFQDSLGSLWTSVQELQKDPTSAVTEGSFVSTASQFIERAQAVYDGLSNYQDNLNSRVQGYVDDINSLGKTILELNLKIAKEEVGESEANDLRDQRNLALDKLSSLANISYSTNVDGGIEVMLEGVTFVSRDRVFEMGTVMDDGTGFYTPVWPQNKNAPVYELNSEISTDNNNDIGQLKAIILARGDRRANYTDMEDATYKYGRYNGEQYQSTSSSIIMNVEAQFDQLIHNIVTEINNILTGEKASIDAGGTPSYATKDDEPKELFVRLGTERYDSSNTYVAENSTDHSNIDSLYSISNLKINPDIMKTPSKLKDVFLTEDKQVNQQVADDLANAFSVAQLSIAPGLAQKYNYKDYYSAMVGQVATDGSVYQSIVSAQEKAVSQLEDSRQQIVGVSSSEELTNMIKYQNAYNAASRYITACNEMLENMMSQL